jgi:hypothetical protein
MSCHYNYEVQGKKQTFGGQWYPLLQTQFAI